MGTWCACDLNFNTFSLWDPLTLWTCWKWTTNLSSVLPIISSATASVSPYNFRTLCSSVWYIPVVFEGELKEIIFRDLYVGNAVARSTHIKITLEIDFERTWLPNTSWRVCKTTYSVFRLAPSRCKHFVHLPPPLDDWNDSSCSSCHFYRLLTVLSQWSVIPCLLIRTTRFVCRQSIPCCLDFHVAKILCFACSQTQQAANGLHL